jgi:hypothetical protein
VLNNVYIYIYIYISHLWLSKRELQSITRSSTIVIMIKKEKYIFIMSLLTSNVFGKTNHNQLHGREYPKLVDDDRNLRYYEHAQ